MGSVIQSSLTMKTIATISILLIASQAVRAQIEVNIDPSEVEAYGLSVKESLDRTFLCCQVTGQNTCASACAGQACTATCTIRCGFLRTCPSQTCQTYAPTTCTAAAVPAPSPATSFPPRGI